MEGTLLNSKLESQCAKTQLGWEIKHNKPKKL